MVTDHPSSVRFQNSNSCRVFTGQQLADMDSNRFWYMEKCLSYIEKIVGYVNSILTDSNVAIPFWAKAAIKVMAGAFGLGSPAGLLLDCCNVLLNRHIREHTLKVAKEMRAIIALFRTGRDMKGAAVRFIATLMEFDEKLDENSDQHKDIVFRISEILDKQELSKQDKQDGLITLTKKLFENVPTIKALTPTNQGYCMTILDHVLPRMFDLILSDDHAPPPPPAVAGGGVAAVVPTSLSKSAPVEVVAAQAVAPPPSSKSAVAGGGVVEGDSQLAESEPQTWRQSASNFGRSIVNGAKKVWAKTVEVGRKTVEIGRMSRIIIDSSGEIRVASQFFHFYSTRDYLDVILRLEKGAFVPEDGVTMHGHVNTTLTGSCFDLHPCEVHIARLLQQSQVCHNLQAEDPDVSEVSTVGHRLRTEQEKMLANVHYLFHHVVRVFCTSTCIPQLKRFVAV